MALTCSRCLRSIDFVGERPSFCAYCGQPLPGSSPPLGLEMTEAEPDLTLDYLPGTFATSYRAPRGLPIALPDSVAGYRLIRLLGRGGMGSVHEAEDSTSGRRVAVKLIAPEYTASKMAVERFLQEGRLASAIAHPRCVFVLAADQAEGWPYIVMELMPGHTLKDLVETQGPLGQGEAVRKIMDVIEGLEEAHKLGVIHRDVKPSNCFLDGEGRVKVGDFGLSKSLLGSDANLTRTGSFLGTPHYASPEQIKGQHLDARSDVYSVAATLYFLLTGRPPHEANDAAVALARIVSDDAPSMRSIRPEVWSALDQVVLRGLERDRRKRFRSLEEFREALAPFLPGRVALGRVGLRFGAYVTDTLITGVLVAVCMILLNWVNRGFIRPDPHSTRPEAVSTALVLCYFALFEVLGTASPGKRLFRLRVVSVDRGGPMDWREALGRLMIFAAIALTPRRVYLFVLTSHDHGLGEMLSVETIIWVVSYLALLSTARASNGYRGVHELLSGTAVISLPGFFRRRSTRALFDATEPSLRPTKPEGIPATVGAFTIDGALVWTEGRRLLLGEDAGLSRPVWILLRPAGSVATLDARRDVGRIARPRWLASGEDCGWCWDAFVAPVGRPIAELVRTGRRLDWHEVRPILEVLAAELEAGSEDGTLPDSLALERVWVQPDGRVILLDEPLDPVAEEVAPVVNPDPQTMGLELLRRVAICGLSGRRAVDPTHPTAVGAPIPGHVIPAIERLCGLGKPYESIAAFRIDLDLTRDHPTELTNFQRFGHAAYTFVTRFVKSLAFPFVVQVVVFILSYLNAEPLRVLSDEELDRIVLFQSFFWVLIAMLLREGIGGLLFGVTLVRADGRQASHLRVAWREALYWLPLLAVDQVFSILALTGRFGKVHELVTISVVVLGPIVTVGYALFDRGRYLNDRFARTAVVPN
jgi:uncharacterized RDD family membrane protein YckC